MHGFGGPRALGGFDPDFGGGGVAEGGGGAGDFEGEGFVGVAVEHAEGGTGADAETVEVFEEFAVAFVGGLDVGGEAFGEFV